ncbi:unnamed protein product [Allacma fusca]|uniref:Uncharacterized protein n=1 Tax=Allacma fusca TaxID=39272 RepID=A0A8J2LKC8_9HEXA|nr:unnamed protein product [Allacma fusca]
MVGTPSTSPKYLQGEAVAIGDKPAFIISSFNTICLSKSLKDSNLRETKLKLQQEITCFDDERGRSRGVNKFQITEESNSISYSIVQSKIVTLHKNRFRISTSVFRYWSFTCWNNYMCGVCDDLYTATSREPSEAKKGNLRRQHLNHLVIAENAQQCIVLT